MKTSSLIPSLVFMALGLLLPAGPLAAQSLWNNAGTGDWFLDTNWTPTGEPGASTGVQIDNGGTMQITSGLAQSLFSYLGYNFGSSGTAVVSGGEWSNSENLYVGYIGTGELHVSGGKVSNTNGYLGEIGRGTAVVSGGEWINSRELTVGYGGPGELQISGGKVSNTRGFLGYDFGSSGKAVISGGEWSNSGDLYMGYVGTGLLTVSQTGKVSVGGGTGLVTLAALTDSKGTLNLGDGTGAPGTFSAGEVTGGVGTAKVNFNHTEAAYTFAPKLTGNLAVEVLKGTTILTNANTYTGTTTVTGGVLNIQHANALGSTAAGTSVSDGAALQIQGGITTAAEPLTLNGTGVSNTGALRNISGKNTFAGPITLGSNVRINSDSGLLTLSSTITGDYNLTVGGAGDTAIQGGLDIGGGGLYLIKDGTGTLTLSAANAYADNTFVRGGTLEVVTGAAFNHSIDIFEGYLTVSGASGDKATLKVSGGTVSSQSGSLGEGGYSGTAEISGGESINTGTLDVGYQGTGELQISGTGKVRTYYSSMGTYGVSSDGKAVVSGDGEWINSGGLIVGFQGTAVVTLSQTGKVTVGTGGAGLVTLAQVMGSGTLNLGDGTGAAGTFSAGEVTGGVGAAKVNFNHTETAYTFAPKLTGNLAVEVLKGTTILTNANTYTGGTTIVGGILVANNTTGSATGTGVVQVASGGTLGGSGFISGIVTVADGGFIAPGNSPGTLTLGELVLGSTSRLKFELDVPDTVGLTNDLIEIKANLNGSGSTGNLTLDGLLDVTAGVSFGTGTYTLIKYDGTLTDNGLNLGVLPGGSTYTVDTTTLAKTVLLNVDSSGLQFWDGPDTVADNTVDGGGGTWNNSLTNWTKKTGATNTTWGDQTAVFTGAAGTVDLTENVTAKGMQFLTGGYVISTANGSKVTLDGAAGFLTDPGVTATVAVPLTGAGSLEKNGTGTLVLTGSSDYSGGTLVHHGTLVVDGASAGISHVSADLTVGEDNGDKAIFQVKNGGIVKNNLGLLGTYSGSSGTAEISGGEWSNSSALHVGYDGTGELKVSSTGKVSSVDGVLGSNTGSSGTAEISGGEWSNLAGLYVGYKGTGELQISGGKVSNTYGYLGLISGSSGKAVVSGGEWINSGDLNVGYAGTGELQISGGKVSNRYEGYLGFGAGSTGTAVVSGGEWENGGDLRVGYLGTGLLTVSQTGTVTVGGGNGLVMLALINGSNGTLNLGDGTGAPGTLSAGDVKGGFGTAKVNFNHEVAAYTFAPVLTGSLAVEVLKGTTIFDKDNTYTGGTTLTGGILVVNNTTGSGTGTGDVIVNGGKLMGSGLISGAVVFNGPAIISPGNSPGTLNMGGDLTLGPATVLDFELGPPGIVGGGVNDLINVAGNLTLDGLLNITDAGGFGAGTYRLINYELALTNNGLTVNSVPAGVNPGDLLVDVGTPGQVNLIYTLTAGTVPGFVPGQQYWDGSNTGANGVIDGGSGVWNNTSTNWTNVQGLINGAWAGQTAIFRGTPGVVTLGSDVPFQQLIFQVGGYRIESPLGYKLYALGDAGIEVQTGRTTLAAPATIAGTFTKSGPGLLDLRSYLSAASTQITQGALAVNGVLDSPTVSVFHGATLMGSGLVIGNVFNHGTVAPGNSIGTLSIHGNYRQYGNGTLQIEVASTSHHDVLLVSGTARLGGTLEIKSLGYDAEYGDQIAFLQARKITGKFSRIEMPHPDTYRGRFLNAGGVGVLLVAPTSYTLVAQTPNQHRLATALDKWIGTEEGDIGEVTLALDSQREEQYPQAFEAIMPRYYETALNTAFELSHNRSQMLTQQLSARHLMPRRSQPIAPLPLSAKSAKAVAPEIQSETNDLRWYMWMQGNGLFSSGGISLTPGEDFESGTFMVGADYRLTENLAVGWFASYQEGWGDYDFSGDVDMTSTNFGIYVTFAHEGFYANAALGFGQTNFDIERPIQLASLERTAASNPDALEFNAMISGGYDFKIGRFTLGPQASLQYTRMDVYHFAERGAGSLDLSVDDFDAESLRSYIGARVAYTIQITDRVALIPELRVFWQHEYLGSGASLNASLDGGAGPSFRYETEGRSDDTLIIGAGINLIIGPRFSASLYYSTTLSSDQDPIHTVTLTSGYQL